jgi:hypothetical protein
MTIDFSCDECGKDYQVSPALAGKKGRCKQCGHTMRIPDLALATATASAGGARGGLKTFGAEPSAPRRPASAPPAPHQTKAKPKAKPTTEDDDPYGFADAEPEPEPLAPLPPAMRRPAFQPEPTAPAGKPKKKKKGGFFASKANGGSGGSRAAGGASIGGVIAVVLFVLRLVVAGGNFFTLSSASEIESFAQADVAAANEMTTILATVRDEPTARAALPRLSAILDRMIALGKQVQGKKGRMTDINAVKQKYEAQQEMAWQRVANEAQRVGSVPGGPQALQSLQGKFQELEAILKQSGATVRNG